MFRKDSGITFESINDQQFNALTANVRRLGAEIIRGSDSVEEHLKKANATASTIGNMILFRKNVCMSEVLGETRHFMQNMEGLNDEKSEPLRTYLNEIDAREYIINYKGKYTVPREEIENEKIELEEYKRMFEEYIAGGGGE